jgi:hypothetical protein
MAKPISWFAAIRLPGTLSEKSLIDRNLDNDQERVDKLLRYENVRWSVRGFDDVGHSDAHMAFVIDALAVADQEYLGGFMVDLEEVGDPVGDRPVIDQVEVVEIDGFRAFPSFQPAFDYGAGGATGTVFKDQLGTVGRFGLDLFELCLGV